jgi:hypothetical protein
MSMSYGLIRRGRAPVAVVLLMLAGAAAQAGPDVIVGDIPDVQNYGLAAGKYAYAIGTTSCNLGDAPLTWIDCTSGPNCNIHPVISQNMYRLQTVNGSARFEQIGQAWLKHGFCALQGTVCSACTPGGNCDALFPGCSDPYSSSLNGSQSGLGPKSEVNASTGAFPYPWILQGTNTNATLFKRLQVNQADVGIAGAQYFVASMYVQPEDAAAGNDNNNQSYRPCTTTGGTLSLTGSTQRGKPAIQAWKDVDATVTISNVDVPADGRFIIASKATDLGGGTWHYEYAVQNLNSDRSGQAFTIPLPSGAVVTNIGFKDVDYHSGEPYALTDWSSATASNSITWSTQTYAQNVNANALRWDTIYNFRFDCNVAPASAAGVATITLFKPGSPATACGLAVVPAGTGGVCVPGNDACANAFNVGAGSTSFDTTFATTDGPSETLCTNAGDSQVGKDVWFRYTAAIGGLTTVSTCGSGFDTKVAVYGAACPSAANTAIACNDDSGTCGTNSLQSYLTFTATQGATYLVRVGGYTSGGNTTSGAGTLTISPPGPTAPPNDACANAITVAYPSVTAFNSALATSDGPTPTNCGTGNTVGNDIWYRVTPCASGTVTVSTCGANYDSVLAVYQNVCPPTNSNQLACNDDSCGLQSQLTFTAVAGTTYLIRVGGYQGATGSGNLTISGPSCPVVPANNDCANRAGIGLGATPINTTGATTDGPTTPCGQIGQDIWYNHPATCTGRMTITMCGLASNFDSMLAVYADAGCTNLAGRLITCNNDGADAACSGGRAEISLNIVTGRNYTIRLGGVGAATGTGTLTLTCTPRCRGDWNGDGSLTPADVAAFVNDWSSSLTTGTLLGDFDGNGSVVPADVAAFVSQWSSDLSGSCP